MTKLITLKCPDCGAEREYYKYTVKRIKPPYYCKKCVCLHRVKVRYWQGKRHSPETIEKIKKARAKQKPPWLGKKRSSKTKKKVSLAIKKLWQNPEYTKRMSETHTGKKVSVETREKLRQINLKIGRKPPHPGKGEKNINWKGGKQSFVCCYCGKTFKSYQSQRKCEATFCSMKCYKASPEALKKIISRNQTTPNKEEKQFDKLLQVNFPNEWKYVGNGDFILAGKNPDFVNMNGRKMLIELFGEYWHRPEEEEERKKIFANYGYQTLIVWCKELRKPDKLIQKVKLFSSSN